MLSFQPKGGIAQRLLCILKQLIALMQVVFLSLQYYLYGIFLNPLYVCKVNMENLMLLRVKHNSLALHSPVSLYFRPGRVHIP